MDILQDWEYKLIGSLNDKQKSAVRSILGENLVIAGAGSGKTAVLTRRCAYLICLGVAPGSILSLTFTNKAAAEMSKRIKEILSEIGINLPNVPPWKDDYLSAPLFCTFHSLGVRILREFGQILGYKKEFTILDKEDHLKLIRSIMKEMNLDQKQILPSLVSHFIGQCKQELLMAQNSKNLTKEFLPVFHTIYARYEARLLENQSVDFDDLILLPYLILKKDNEALQICRARWKHIQIDEFQDTNQAQFATVKLLYPPN
jgi:DNA helicase II / ATP-dependent DNA helicase PcrA